MSLEQRLRSAIDQHVGEQSTSDRAWNDIQRRMEAGPSPQPKPHRNRGQRIIAAAVAVVVFGVVAVGLGLAIRHGTPSTPAASPPAWLVDKARLEARANGDPAPTSAEWVLTDAATIQRTFGYVNASEPDPAYVVILHGQFTSGGPSPVGASAPKGSLLFLVLDPQSHNITDWGLGNHDFTIPGLAPLPISSSPSPSPSRTAPEISVDVPSPGEVVAAFGSIWVQSGRDIWELSENGDVVNRFSDLAQRPSLQYMGYGGAGVRTLAAGGGSLWSLDDGALLKINPANGAVIASIPVPNGPGSVAFGEGAVWVACCSSGPTTLFKIDPATAQIVNQTSTGVSVASLAVGDGSAWVLGIGEVPYVKRYDAVSLHMLGSIIPVDARGMVAEGGGNLWVMDHGTGLGLVDPDTNRVRDITVKGGPMMGLVTYGGDVFINAGSLIRVSGATGTTEVLGDSGRAQLANAGIALMQDQSAGGLSAWLAEPADDTVVAFAIAQGSDASKLELAYGTDPVAGRWSLFTEDAGSGPSFGVDVPGQQTFTSRLSPLDGRTFGTWSVTGVSDSQLLAQVVDSTATRVEIKLDDGTTFDAALVDLPPDLIGPAKVAVVGFPSAMSAEGTQFNPDGVVVAYGASGKELGRWRLSEG